MRIVDRFPHPVQVVENEWVVLPDGTRLAARIWLPEDAETRPVPAVLEYLPYRKRDFTRLRDEPMHHYIAGHGYACLRVDVRGAGDSEGLLRDEYSEAELQDGVAVIDWIARQPWCSGAVGMTGISWGGFNSLQVAARAPAALKAIMTLCASDDRYADDAHYMGGCLLNENLTWGGVLTQFNAYPPDPEISGPGWRKAWTERLEAAIPFPAHWLRHQRRDHYWKRGSVCEDLEAIRCPVYAIGGWADGYSNAVPRLLAGLSAPRKGLIGPWAHNFPHDPVPGPAIGFLQEALRWWDHWLKGIDRGLMDEPAYRVWMQDWITPAPHHETRPGRWVAESSWPSPRIETQRLAINATGLGPDPIEGPPLAVRSLETTGLCAGDWCAFGADGEMPTDQRRDDGTSLTFDSDPLAEPLELLGAPLASLALSADRPAALVALRLCDVAPDGSSLRISYGLLDLTHRRGHETPEALVPGQVETVRVALNHLAHRVPAGHRLRLALSTTYWPIAWPAPEPATLTLLPGRGRLELPVRPPHPGDEALRPFEEPEQAPKLGHSRLRPGRFRRTYERDLQSNETVYTIFSDQAEFPGASLARIEAIDLTLAYSMSRRYRIAERDPATARAEVEQKTRFERGSWRIRVETRFTQTATPDHFRVEGSLRAYEADLEVFARDWDERIPRTIAPPRPGRSAPAANDEGPGADAEGGKPPSP